MPSLQRIPSFTAALFLALVAIAFTAVPAEGQVDDEPAITQLSTTEESAIAVPFIGDFEVWCTDRNPAPGTLCRNHHGSPAIDIGMDPGTPIHAAGSGTVIEADNFCPARGACNNGKGNSVVIAHADETFSRYIHLSDVSVSLDQVVSVGELIGASGESGQTSSPHLHYDEHFPRGTRAPFGQWVGCVGGEPVLYPDALGTDDWYEVEFGSRIVNEDFDCLVGFDTDNPENSPSAEDPVDNAPDAPRVLAGTTHFGVTPSTEIARKTFELSIRYSDGSPSEVIPMFGSAMIYRPAPAGTMTFSIRESVGGVWTAWSDTVDYSASNSNEPVCGGLFATTTSMTGTPDVDVIIGTNSADTITTRGGDDVICGLGGNDDIHAGIGKDRVLGGDGDDSIIGGIGFDILRGEDGADSIRGGEGNDTIVGGPGADTLEGNAGSDFLNGGDGDDTLIGGIGHDTVTGKAGDDTIEGRNGRDVLFGDNGADSLDGGNGRDVLSGGNGNDSLSGGSLADSLDGGPGADECSTDSSDLTTSGCEQ